ncbi:MAG TPA: nucleotidyltransferase family protein [Verrucomicrobiota bacterium]|nr:nucleotidyltransferase family protein [Verrucomicrobiota bacterium]
MEGLVLAAGYATRLYPVTLTQSKCLLKVAGKPMIDYVIEKLLPLPGLKTIYVVSNAKYYDSFKEWLDSYSSNKPKIPIELVNDGSTDDSNKLGAIGDIQFVIKNKNINTDLLIIAGDNLLTGSIDGFLRFCKQKNSPVLGVYDIKQLSEVSKYSSVVVDSTEKIVDFIEKPADPKNTKIGIALYYYPKSVLPLFDKYISEGNNKDQPGRFVQWLYKLQPVYACEIPGIWFDVGDINVLEKAEKFLLNKKESNA